MQHRLQDELQQRSRGITASPSQHPTTTTTPHGFASSANAKLYNDWVASYEKDTTNWGYELPNQAAALLYKHLSAPYEFLVFTYEERYVESSSLVSKPYLLDKFYPITSSCDRSSFILSKRFSGMWNKELAHY